MSEAPEGVPPMVHAVAEALRADCLRTFGATWSYDVSWAFARAAIEAMREPTPEMVTAGVDRFSDLFQAGVGSEYLMTETAKAMIDAALAEPTAPR